MPRTAILALSVLVCAIACDAFTTVRGVVLDGDHRPIADAEVRLIAAKSGKTDTRRTASDGSFLARQIHGALPGQFTLVVTKEGFGEYRREIDPNADLVLEVILTRDGHGAKRE